MKKEIVIFNRTGSFAENKDVAKDIRINEIIPELDAGKIVLLDFSNVDSATQSFMHALISEVIRKKGPVQKDKIIDILDNNGQSLDFAQPGARVALILKDALAANDLIRRPGTGENARFS